MSVRARGRISMKSLVIDGETIVENFSQAIVIGPSSKRIALVACSAQKASKPTAARDLYTSPLFRAARAYAEATCARWYILSAKYGLLEPLTLVDPYDQMLTAARASSWGLKVGAALDRAVPYATEADAELVVLAGALYADSIHTPLNARGGAREFYWSEPLRGLGVGERLHWLQQNTPRSA